MEQLSIVILATTIMYPAHIQNYIISLAKKAIEHFFDTRTVLCLDEREMFEQLKYSRACFVTLTLNGALRGCIGHIEAIQPLYLDIIENAVSAAFEDPRFPPLTREEYQNVEVEVSVLTSVKPLFFSSPKDLMDKLRPGIDGVIIRRGSRGATYLPQVWEDMSNKEEFLSSLCLKAGLPADDWKRHGLQALTYEVEAIKEKNNGAIEQSARLLYTIR